MLDSIQPYEAVHVRRPTPRYARELNLLKGRAERK